MACDVVHLLSRYEWEKDIPRRALFHFCFVNKLDTVAILLKGKQRGHLLVRWQVLVVQFRNGREIVARERLK